uniref:CSON012044 protein n=1 Tax=Culicoides sonorensis TaxID=179676 RepID=A0A336MGH7_CULSO
MHINNPDALRNWLTVILEPLCDADPAALARYVLALLKKEKPAKELKQCMQEQLDVFLGQETTPFLERLFEAMKSEEYLSHAVAPHEGVGSSVTTTTTPLDTQNSTSSSSLATKSERECTPPLLNDNKTKEYDSISLSPFSSIQSSSGGGGSTSTATTTITTPHNNSRSKESPTRNKDDALSHTSSNSREVNRRRNRSRSRSFDRNLKRSRSKERRNMDHGRDRNVHKYRNKSPPNTRRFERRGGAFNRRNRSQSGSRSRSASPDRKKPSRSISPSLATEQDNLHSKKRQRCRDFDEKGYCMRGETCPWDHGVDPVVLEDINNPALLTIQQNAPLRGAPVHPEYNPYAPDLWNRGNMRPGGPANMNANAFGRLPPGARPPNPSFSFPMNQAVTPLQQQQQQQQQQQRELIPVPVVDGSNQLCGDMMQAAGQLPPHIKRRFDQEDPNNVNEGPNKRKPPIQNRLGPRVPSQQNCSLELRKIPRGLNAIAHLNNHFSKFGKIVNIQISYEGDPEAAIVTFSTHAEANVAYRSTEAVLNNRFIKVFWHSPNGGNANGDQSTPAASKPENPMSFRKNNYPNQYHINHKVTNTGTSEANNNVNPPTSTTTTNTSETDSSNPNNSVVDPKSGTITTQTATGTQSISNKGMTLVNTAAGAQPPVAAPVRIVPNPKLKREVAQLARKQKENAVQVACGLMKKKQSLLEGYVKQMQSTVGLLERSDVTEEQKKTYIATIKELEAKIVALRKEIAAEQQRLAAVQPPIQVRKTKEQKQKELLDVELDLITQEHDGNDTSAIQRKLKELQKSIHTAKSRIRSGPQRIAPPGSTSVDRRPTTLCVTGFELDESDIILGHFKHFGEITKNELDKTVPSLTISYATRLNAEQAMQRGRIFKEKPLHLSWVTATTAAPITAKPVESVSSGVSDDQQPSLTQSTGVDDDEEEIEEERSWRR